MILPPKHLVVSLFLGLILTACAATDGARTDSRQSSASSGSTTVFDDELALFRARKFEKAGQIIEAKLDGGVYAEKDRVMHFLNAGIAYYYAGNVKKSAQLFGEAEDAIDQNFTKSIARGALSFMTNDNTLVYDGDLYEDVMINQFKMLSFLRDGDLDKALVESRRTAYKLEQVIVKAKGMADLYMKDDNQIARQLRGADQRASFDVGKLPIQDLAAGHYFAAMIFAHQRRPDNARIEIANFKKAHADNQSYYGEPINQDLIKDAEKLLNPDAYNVVFVGYTGRGPRKIEHKADVQIPFFNMDLIFAYPELEYYQSLAARVDVTIDDKQTINLKTLENFSRVSAEVYKVKEPIIYTRAFLRGAVKAYGAKKLTDEAESRLGAVGGFATRLAARGVQSASESADLRTWHLMPAIVNVATVKLEPGEHKIDWKFYDANGQLLMMQTKMMFVRVGQSLHVDDALYFN